MGVANESDVCAPGAQHFQILSHLREDGLIDVRLRAWSRAWCVIESARHHNGIELEFGGRVVVDGVQERLENLRPSKMSGVRCKSDSQE